MIETLNNVATAGLTPYFPEFERINGEGNNDIFLNLSNGRGLATAKLQLLWYRIIRERAHEGVTQHYQCTNGSQ